MSIYEYDQEKHMRFLREDSFEEGYSAGEKAAKTQYVKKLLLSGTVDDRQIMELFDISSEELKTLKETVTKDRP